VTGSIHKYKVNYGAEHMDDCPRDDVSLHLYLLQPNQPLLAEFLRMSRQYQEFTSREIAQRQKNNVISGFIRSLVLNTSTLGPRDGWSGALQSAL